MHVHALRRELEGGGADMQVTYCTLQPHLVLRKFPTLLDFRQHYIFQQQYLIHEYIVYQDEIIDHADLNKIGQFKQLEAKKKKLQRK